MYPGEYSQPLPRKHFVNCPVVSGYVTARLQAEDVSYPPGPSGLAFNTNVTVTFENIGGTAFSVLLRETDERGTAGVRHTVLNAGTLVPGGQVTKLGSASHQYLEVYAVGLSAYYEGELRMQIESQRQWREMGFDRTDPFYPAKLWQATVTPVAIP